jgi:RNA polymerase sigma-70 factor (ECF subfamily)
LPVPPDEFERLAIGELDAAVRFARALAHSPAEAEDLVQEAYVKAIQAREQFDPERGSIRSWLFAILRNTWLNRVARRQIEPTAASELVDTAVAHPQAPKTLDWSDCDQRLAAAVRELPEALRTTLLLWAIDELKYQEIADVMQVPVGTVMSRLHRARGLLCERLAPLARDLGRFGE